MPRPFDWSRREWLGTAGALTAGALAAGLDPRRAAAMDDEVEEPYIDAHSHIWGRDVDRFPLAEGQTVDDLDPPSFTDDELLETCRPLGVGRVVLIQHHIYHGWDNRYLIDAARRRPERFRVVGMVDDTAPEPDRKMVAMLDQHVTGFRITPWIRGRDQWLTGKGMGDMWHAAAKSGQAMCCLIDPEDLADIDRMCARFPRTRVVIDHFARIGVDGTIRDEHVDALCKLARHPKVRVKLSAYYALGRKMPPYDDLVPMIRRVLDAFGPERCMWASDAPYQLQDGNSYQASIDLIRSGIDFLSDGDKEWLLHKTAHATFFELFA